MSKIKDKIYDWKDRLRDRHMLSIVVTLVTIIAVIGLYTYKREREFRQVSENRYNMAFFELVNYVENVGTYLEKSLVSSTPEHGVETLTHVWREANLAQAYLSQLPIGSQELSNTSKFLNQVSDYSFSLSRKNIYDEPLTQEDLENLKSLHDYSVELQNTLNQLSADMNDGRIRWGELTQKGSSVFATEVSNISKDSFSNVEGNFHEYAGLIYDGAFSEHITSIEKKGLTGENIDEEKAKQLLGEYIQDSNVKDIVSKGLSENTDIPCFNFDINLEEDDKKEGTMTISITQKGGHLAFFNHNRNIGVETISEKKAVEIGKEFLNSHNYKDMKETYYMKQEGIVTINYAYNQKSQYGDIVAYPDLIKVKIALDNGEVLGVETTGYLNSHCLREINPQISAEKAKEGLNQKLEIQSQRLAIIPTEFKTELLCWEFKAKVDDSEYLIYIDANNGKEEDILVLKVVPNGTLAM